MICENIQELEMNDDLFNLSTNSINRNITQLFINNTNNITTSTPSPSNVTDIMNIIDIMNITNTTHQLNNSNISRIPISNTTEKSPSPSLNMKDKSTPSPNIRGLKITRSSPSSINMKNVMNATKPDNNSSTTKNGVNTTGIIIWSTVGGVFIVLLLSSIIMKVKRNSGGVHPCPPQQEVKKQYKLRDPNSLKRPKDYLIERINRKKKVKNGEKKNNS